MNSATFDDKTIVQFSVLHTCTYNYDEEKYAAVHAADNNLETASWTVPNKLGWAWFEIRLDRQICVEHVISHHKDGSRKLTWTCSLTDCNDCEGKYCGRLHLTVSGNGEEAPHTLLPDCKYGNVVKITTWRTRTDNGNIHIQELSITTKKGRAGDLTGVAYHNVQISITKFNELMNYMYY